MIRFLSALAILLLALTAQFILGNAGLHLNLALAVLIALAFIFDFWELALFVLLSVFLINWRPGFSGTLILFALIPMVVFALRKFYHSQPAIGAAIAILIGFLIFYTAPNPEMFGANFVAFLIDVAAGLLIGEAVLFALN
jgi:hypothetical protein